MKVVENLGVIEPDERAERAVGRETLMKFYIAASTASRPVLLFAAESGMALDLQLVDTSRANTVRRPIRR